jgi:3-carboxy-cis,cis-muconate cycloisomerase
MPATIIDSALFGDLFSNPAMRLVFSDERRIQYYLDIEGALARVQARLEIIPKEAAEEISRHCFVEQIDMARLKKQIDVIGHPVLPVVQQLVGLCSNGMGEWCHWGTTTQDIIDTATIMQVRDALNLVEQDLAAISDSLASLAERYRDTPMAGRTKTQQAVPISFGLKMAVLLATFERHRERLREMRARVLVGQFAGAAGTLASLGKDGLRIQEALMVELGLGQPEIAWHTMRDRFAEVGCFLGLVTGTLGKIAMDINLMAQTEVQEVSEAFTAGRGSSSTMPQKRNPVSTSYILACTGVVRQQVGALLDAMVAEHERSNGPWEIEWIVVPEIFSLASGALAHTRSVLSGLQVDPERMRKNLEMTGGMIVAEAVMMGLGPYLGRQRAHDLVYEICRAGVASGRPLLDLLAENQEISRHADRAALAKLIEPANYLGVSGEMIDRVLTTYRAVPPKAAKTGE